MAHKLSFLSIENIGSFLGGMDKIHFFLSEKNMYRHFKETSLDFVLDTLETVECLEDHRIRIDTILMIYAKEVDQDQKNRLMEKFIDINDAFYEFLSVVDEKIDPALSELFETAVEKITEKYDESIMEKIAMKERMYNGEVLDIEPFSSIDLDYFLNWNPFCIN